MKLKNSGLAVVIVAAALLTACGTSKVQFGKDEIRYSGKATQEEAKALGDALKSQDYLQDHGVTVQVGKDDKGTTVSYVVKDGIWDNGDTVAGFGLLTGKVSSTVGGLPLTMRLVNQNFDVKKEVVLHPKLMVGDNKEINYFDAATEKDAKALADALKTAGYFDANGATVQLTKNTEGTVVAFIVVDGFWDSERNVALFGQLGRTIAPAVGGLPLKVRLMSTALKMKKEIPLS